MQGTISLTKPLQKWVVEQAAARGLKDGKAFVHQLLLEEKKRQAVQALIQSLEEAEASGYHEVTEELWEARKKRVAAHFHGAKRKSKAK